MRQQCRSAMAPPQHEPTSCQIDVVSSRQVSMSLQASEAVLYLENMLAFACSQATLVKVIPFLTATSLCLKTALRAWGGRGEKYQ